MTTDCIVAMSKCENNNKQQQQVQVQVVEVQEKVYKMVVLGPGQVCTASTAAVLRYCLCTASTAAVLRYCCTINTVHWWHYNTG